MANHQLANLRRAKSYTVGPTNTVIKAGKPLRLTSPTDIGVLSRSGFLVLEDIHDVSAPPRKVVRRTPAPDVTVVQSSAEDDQPLDDDADLLEGNDTDAEEEDIGGEGPELDNDFEPAAPAKKVTVVAKKPTPPPAPAKGGKKPTPPSTKKPVRR